MTKYSDHMTIRSHSQVSERLKELTTKVKPPRPTNPPTTTVSAAQKGVAKSSNTTSQQHNKQQIDTQAELLYQISEGVSVDHVIMT